MNKKSFRVNKKVLIYIAISSILLGLIFPAERSESGAFFSTDLLVKSLIIAMIGGSIAVLVGYIEYKKETKDK
ncbi:MAG: hypothetical protein RBQ97_07485 [Acholeplasma sp.]|jgi:hypothetical protein|nr:hypothetical protein [Acholeplasma sp.]